MGNLFNYKEAFSRNLGWLTSSEQLELSTKTVCIAGVGGVGGQYAEVLARLGVKKFHLADFDEFEIQNFNRQNGSGISTIGQKKVKVIQDLILDINPEAEIEIYESGVNLENISTFLNHADLYLDGLDFFVLDIREQIFHHCRQKNIPAITIAPVGMGASLVAFGQGSMSFSQYFQLHKATSPEDKAARFLVGLTPTLMQAKYLVDKSRSNFKEKKAPSLSVGPYLCAGIAGSWAIKVLLKRGKVSYAPSVFHFDSYLNSYKKSYIFWGGSNPLQKIKLFILKKILEKKK